MSCVDDIAATSSAPSATNSGERAGSVSASSRIAAISSSCENTSQPRRRPNVRVKRGAKLTWLFKGAAADLHNVTLANGPRGFASPNYGTKAKFSYRFKVRGRYQIFCGLHPVAMTETVTVK